MPTDKQLYNLYLKEMKKTGLQVDKKLAAFVDSFANRVIKEPNRDIAVIYREEVKSWGIIDETAKTIQGGMINQTAIGYGIMPEFSADIMGVNSTVDLQKIFGKRKGKALSKGVYDSVTNSQKTVYNSIVKNAKLNKTWKETSTELRKTLKGNIKGYENIPKHIKELEEVGRKALTSKDSRAFIKRLEKSRLQIENLSDNRSLKQSYKGAFNRLESAIKKNDSVMFEKAIKQATYAKNQSLSERTIITEQSRVFEQSKYDARVENPLITGVTFNLSSNHDEFDECDIIANTDNGQGIGVYSLKNQPAMPIHPNGVSFLTDVLIDEMTQKQADKLGYDSNKMNFEKGGETLSPSKQRALKEMQFMKPVKVDKEYLTDIVSN
ncbi:MAG: hypothetical protein GY928_03405 [Colwellia sp.]|nr:hypothetical protein [Colwellia sp.]